MACDGDCEKPRNFLFLVVVAVFFEFATNAVFAVVAVDEDCTDNNAGAFSSSYEEKEGP